MIKLTASTLLAVLAGCMTHAPGQRNNQSDVYRSYDSVVPVSIDVLIRIENEKNQEKQILMSVFEDAGYLDISKKEQFQQFKKRIKNNFSESVLALTSLTNGLSDPKFAWFKKRNANVQRVGLLVFDKDRIVQEIEYASGSTP